MNPIITILSTLTAAAIVLLLDAALTAFITWLVVYLPLSLFLDNSLTVLDGTMTLRTAIWIAVTVVAIMISVATTDHSNAKR